jgi:hypothetical protein
MIRAFQWDLARQVERLGVLKKLLPRYARWGYNELYLHLEDAVHYPSLPGIGRDDAYSYEELGELVLTAAQSGIRVVPIVNLLGHTQYLIKHHELRELNELRNERGAPLVSGQICPLHPRTLDVAAKLLRDMAPYCTAGKVHVGLDESFHLGQCPRCRAEVGQSGLHGHFAGHVNRLHQLTTKLGLQLGLWADMLYFVPAAIPLLPSGIIAYDWYYYPFNRQPRVEFFNFAERDLHPALNKQGIRYYGCPMNGAFRHEPLPVFGDRLANIRSWWQRCQAVAADGMLVTSWEPYRLAFETTTVVDAAAAGLWLDPAKDDDVTMLSGGLRRALGVTEPLAVARELLKADGHAFAGYARWQINDRWDTFAGTEGVKPYERELGFFRRQEVRATRDHWPTALAASIAFRTYLAERDVFVRRAARDVMKLRRLVGKPAAFMHALQECRRQADEFAQAIRHGRHAARQMWRRTRDPGRTGHNDRILAEDAVRLKAWQRWLRLAVAQPLRAMNASPVCGSWQVQFWVHNFAPAVQKVVLEERQPDGLWREIAARYTIEFRAAAARPHSKIKREFTAPVSAPDAALRIAVRGVGQVAISHVQVTNGVQTRRARNYHIRHILGEEPPTAGFPQPAGERNAETLPVSWPEEDATA